MKKFKSSKLKNDDVYAKVTKKITDTLTKNILFIIFFFFYVNAQTNLSGNISGMILTSEGNPYIISDNLVIPENKSLTIKKGCVFLFNTFNDIVVEGSLSIEGTFDNPVNDTTYLGETVKIPNPYAKCNLNKDTRNFNTKRFITVDPKALENFMLVYYIIVIVIFVVGMLIRIFHSCCIPVDYH